MADPGNRPLSPHLTVYRWQVTMLVSILTRITGNGLTLAGLLVVWWFLAAAVSPGAFATADAVLTSWLGDLVLAASLWALWYHFLAGLRHLWMDTGRGFAPAVADRVAWAVLAGSALLTALTLAVV
jgi:succinate dehydrogenase / fumarate reductase cytochrome b subunit